MREDLLFHITTREEWKENQSEGVYKPESVEKDGIIHCVTGSQLEDVVNKLYPDKDKVLLLVIDVSMLREQIKYETDDELGIEIPLLEGALSINAIIDKIDIQAEDSGNFKISFTSDS